MTACSGMSRSHTATTWLSGSPGSGSASATGSAGSNAGSAFDSATGSAVGSAGSAGSRQMKVQVLSYFLLGLAWCWASSKTELFL